MTPPPTRVFLKVPTIPGPMVHPGVFSPSIANAVFIVGSGIVSTVLLGFSLRAFARTRSRTMAFIATAFTIFAVKNYVLGYALFTGAMSAPDIALLDAAADMTTVLLLVLPIFIPRG